MASKTIDSLGSVMNGIQTSRLPPSQGAVRGGGRFVDPRVVRVKAMVRSHLHLKLSLPDLAHASGLSVSRLSHLFKGELGTAPVRYVKQVRLECARELLETTFLSVKEICTRVGLNDFSHFVRDFEIAYGTSPSRYRSAFIMASLHDEDQISRHDATLGSS